MTYCDVYILHYINCVYIKYGRCIIFFPVSAFRMATKDNLCSLALTKTSPTYDKKTNYGGALSRRPTDMYKYKSSSN